MRCVCGVQAMEQLLRNRLGIVRGLGLWYKGRICSDLQSVIKIQVILFC